jgi:hypothetical protein
MALYRGEYAWAEVVDQGGPWVNSAHDGERRRGLSIVAAIAGDGNWGIEGDEASRVVWFRLDWDQARRCLTQPRFARAIGVSVTTVGHAETGRLWQARHFWEGADKELGLTATIEQRVCRPGTPMCLLHSRKTA